MSTPWQMVCAPPGSKLAATAAEKLAAADKEREYLSLVAGHVRAPSTSRSRASDFNSVAPPSQCAVESATTGGHKRHLDQDEYLEADDDVEYQPAPGSPTLGEAPAAADDDDEEEDPLDAYMAGIEVQAKKDKQTTAAHETQTPPVADDAKDKKKLGRTDIDEDDMQESYFKFLEEARLKAEQNEDDDEQVEYDEEGNPIFTWKKSIDPLPPMDHSSVDYTPFERNFYVEHADIAALHHGAVVELRKTLGLTVSGLHPPKPVSSFAHFGFDKQLMAAIRKLEFTQPTPIQAQGIPVALSGRDLIGIAKTGSGKTATYIWPALVHVMHQRELEDGDGPIVLICVPTRELAIQVYNEAKRFAKAYNVNVVCAYGGGSKWEQTKALAEGAEVVVGTPGRIIDLVSIAATNLTRVTYLIFDEADRMFDLGFEPQVRSIASHVRPDRQCHLYSATFKRKVERLARDVLTDPVRVIQGELGEANEDIEQHVTVFPHAPDKWIWLTKRLVEFCAVGKVLIFVTRKQNCEEVAKNLKAKDFNVGLLHGDMFQHDRNEVIQAFRRRADMAVLVATDVAARGLDIAEIRTVINYDVARDIDTHVHRIGRTGRAGQRGDAYTLVSDKDKEFVGHLVRNLESVNQAVPDDLMRLATQSSWFRSARFKEGKVTAIGGSGLGVKQRPGLGAKKAWAAGEMPTKAAPTLREALSQVKAGGGTNRLAAMKAAFGSSYSRTFAAASEETSWQATRPTPDDPKQPEADSTRRKRSRWE